MFTGDVWFDVIAAPQPEPSRMRVNAVHFAPCARTAWHSHAVGQTLHVTEGVGLVQARGGEVVVMRPGDTIYTPPGEWHWHGAAPDHFMTHLAMWEAPAERRGVRVGRPRHGRGIQQRQVAPRRQIPGAKPRRQNSGQPWESRCGVRHATGTAAALARPDPGGVASPRLGPRRGRDHPEARHFAGPGPGHAAKGLGGDRPRRKVHLCLSGFSAVEVQLKPSPIREGVLGDRIDSRWVRRRRRP